MELSQFWTGGGKFPAGGRGSWARIARSVLVRSLGQWPEAVALCSAVEVGAPLLSAPHQRRRRRRQCLRGQQRLRETAPPL